MGAKRALGWAVAGWAAWRILGPEVGPTLRGVQERPAALPGRTVPVGRSEFFVREAGPADAAPLVLLHGWAYDGYITWHRVLPRLAERHRVVSIDLRNHGKSDRIRGRFDVEDLADDVAGVLQALGLGRVSVAGYSMGGLVAQALARRHPGRVERLVLAATAARPLRWPRWVTVPVFLAGRVLARLDRTTAPRIVHRYLISTGVIPPEHSAWLWQCLMDRDSDLYYEAGFAIARFDSTEWVGRLAVPTLVIIPGHDQLIPRRAQRETAGLLREGRVVEIEGARHEAILTHPDRIAGEIVGFLAEDGPRRGARPRLQGG